MATVDDMKDDMKNFERKMLSGLYRFDCPDLFSLGEFQSGFLSKDREKEIENHLKECPFCKKELDYLDEFLMEDPGFIKNNLTEVENIKKIIPFQYKEVHYMPPEIKEAVRNNGVREKAQKKIRITYNATEFIDLFYTIDFNNALYVFKGQFIAHETVEKMLINAMIEIWQNKQIITTVNIDNFCAFHFSMKELSSVIFRITNQTGTTLAFVLDMTKWKE